MNKKSSFKKYITFWLSQSVSQLGSSMTGFALSIWAYSQTGSELAYSFMTFCNYVPYVVMSLFAGAFVDRHRKKTVMLIADFVAAFCSFCVLILWSTGELSIYHIYMVNCVIGFANAFQNPASAVAVGKMVPQEEMGRVSGLNSFSSNLIGVFSPVIAAALYAVGGLGLILVIDFGTFLFAFSVLLFFIRIHEEKTAESKKQTVFEGSVAGLRFLLQKKGLWYIIITMSLLNFLSRLTYENILSPMVLARSGNDSMALGIVSAAMGIGGILGGLIVSAGKLPRDRIKTIYGAAGLSFLLGDIVMGLGRNAFFWSIAGIAASLPIPFIMAAENVILYEKIPQSMQGRVFAVRNALQFGTIPIGILLGGFLAQYVFEPFMQSGKVCAEFLTNIVGSGKGSGMAVMFLCTGLTGGLFSFFVSRKKAMDELRFRGEKEEGNTDE